MTLVPNSQHAQQDVLIADSRKADDRENEVQKHGKTCSSSRADFRIPGIPHSTVEQVETNGKETVRRLTEKFENHPNRNCMLKDFEKSEEINHLSQESKDLITVSRLRFVLGTWYHLLHMRRMHAPYGKESTIQQRQI